MQSLCYRRGFALVEVLVVVVIMAILVVIAYPSYDKHIRRSRLYDAQQAMLDNIRHLEQHYGRYYTFRINGNTWIDLPHTQTEHFCIKMQGIPHSFDGSAFTLKAVAFDKNREPRILRVNQDGMWTECEYSHSSCQDQPYFRNPAGQIDSGCTVK